MSTATAVHVVCARCGTTNRVAEDKLRHEVACGRCGADLLAAEPFALTDENFDHYVGRTELPVLVDEDLRAFEVVWWTSGPTGAGPAA